MRQAMSCNSFISFVILYFVACGSVYAQMTSLSYIKSSTEKVLNLIENLFANLTSYPIGELLESVLYFFCPSRVPTSTIKFCLYTRKSPNVCQPLKIGNKWLLNISSFDPEKPTKFLTHGWMTDGLNEFSQQVKNHYLQQYDLNVIIVDWHLIAKSLLYWTSAKRSSLVGKRYARMLDFLMDNGMQPENVHLIGHSLGAHVCGFAGKFVQKRPIARITGLDPALPLFGNFFNKLPSFQVKLLIKILAIVLSSSDQLSAGLSRTDAGFVDVMHTSGGLMGFMDPLGHADFYPNGGFPPQPGCASVVSLLNGCSHSKAWTYFVRSIENENYLAFKCDNWTTFVMDKDKCSNVGVPMGEHTPAEARGKFYLTTSNFTDQLVVWDL